MIGFFPGQSCIRAIAALMKKAGLGFPGDTISPPDCLTGQSWKACQTREVSKTSRVLEWRVSLFKKILFLKMPFREGHGALIAIALEKMLAKYVDR